VLHGKGATSCFLGKVSSKQRIARITQIEEQFFAPIRVIRGIRCFLVWLWPEAALHLMLPARTKFKNPGWLSTGYDLIPAHDLSSPTERSALKDPACAWTKPLIPGGIMRRG
jgi:hypothetical protein